MSGNITSAELGDGGRSLHLRGKALTQPSSAESARTSKDRGNVRRCGTVVPSWGADLEHDFTATTAPGLNRWRSRLCYNRQA